MDTHLKVALYPRPSASRPPINGPSNDPETPAVCNVPSILPAVSLGVCVEIRACDIGINPVNIPINKRNKKAAKPKWQTPLKALKALTQMLRLLDCFCVHICRLSCPIYVKRYSLLQIY